MPPWEETVSKTPTPQECDCMTYECKCSVDALREELRDAREEIERLNGLFEWDGKGREELVAECRKRGLDLKGETERHNHTLSKWFQERKELTDELVKTRAALAAKDAELVEAKKERDEAKADRDMYNEESLNRLKRATAAEESLARAEKALEVIAGRHDCPEDGEDHPDNCSACFADEALAARAKETSQVRINAEKDPAYAPYCLRCNTMARMKKIEPFYWRCDCGAEHDERAKETKNG